MDCVKVILKTVERLKMAFCKTNEHFIDHIMILTPNLKCLNLTENEIGHEWVHRK